MPGWRRLWDREGSGRLAPKDGIKGYFYLIYTRFWDMLFLNLCFVVFCLPVITIPMALTAMDRVYIKLIRERSVLFWAEFWGEYKGSWKKSIPAGLLFGALLAASYYLLSLGLTNGSSVFGFAFGVVGIVLLLTAVIWGGYTFVLLAVQELPLGTILHNARVLSVVCVRQSAAIAAAVALFFAVSLVHPLALLAVFVLGGVSILQYSICWIVNGPLDELVLEKDKK